MTVMMMEVNSSHHKFLLVNPPPLLMLLLLSSPYYWACRANFNEDSEKIEEKNKGKTKRKKERKKHGALCDKNRGLFLNGFFFFSFPSHNKLQGLSLFGSNRKGFLFAKIKPKTPHSCNSYPS
jgi:hypothetical protein